jgi:hypothetical protein
MITQACGEIADRQSDDQKDAKVTYSASNCKRMKEAPKSQTQMLEIVATEDYMKINAEDTMVRDKA